MSRVAQIAWWVEQVEAARRAIDDASHTRRRPSTGFDDEVKARRGRVVPLPKAPSAHEIIRGTTITGGRDEERTRFLPMASGGGGGGGASTPSGSKSDQVVGGGGPGGGGGRGAGQGGAVGRARQLAAGYQPAVIKVVSYARGVARATATGQYVQREDVALETHDGRVLADRESVADEIKAWSSNFAKRAESHDVGAVRLTLHGVADTPEGRATFEKAIAAGFEGHRHAYRLDVTREGMLEARVVTAMAGPGKERFRVREERVGEEGRGFTQRRLDLASEARAKERITAATGLAPDAIGIIPGATSHGRDGVTYRLNKLIEKGPAIDDRGRAIANVAETRTAAREWGPTLRSQSSRDTMHLIVSAKAGTDVEALTRAARAFLHDRFADHKFMFGVHTDKEAEGHIHVHAVVAVKSESGQKLHPSRETFGEWRQVYAQHAQAEGLKIVATAARERASSQSYGPKDKAIVDAADRPRPTREARDRAYATDPANRRVIDNARQRIAVARTNPIRLPVTALDLKVVNEGVQAWRTVATEQPASPVAKDMLERLLMAQTVGSIVQTIGRRVENLTKENPTMAVTSEQMAKDLRLMNETVSRTSDLLDGETKQQFREASSRYLETLANRIDLQRVSEHGVQQMTRAEVEAIAGVNADRLIERAGGIQQREEREAAAAARLADRAVAAERREEAATGIGPASQRELRAERAIVAGAQKSAAQEAREAAAAGEAAASLAQRPAERLSPALIQTDALARLRAEQEQIIREIEASEGAQAQSSKPQRMT
jgi:type IV secretory pathway VirD2 relaxase